MTNQFYKIFQGAEDFYLADPTKLTIKKNGGHRWGVEREFYQKLPEAINGHLTGQQKLGVYFHRSESLITNVLGERLI